MNHRAMPYLYAARDHALNYLARQDNPEHTLNVLAAWIALILSLVAMLVLSRRSLMAVARTLRERIAFRLRLHRQRRLNAATLASLADPSAFLGLPTVKHPAPHEHTLPPGEAPDMPYCEACRSYHVVPKDAAHHAALQCFATYAPPALKAAIESELPASVAQPFAFGLPAAMLETLPGDPPAPAPLPTTGDALGIVASVAEQGLNDAIKEIEIHGLGHGVVMLNGQPFPVSNLGYTIKPNPPRAPQHECMDAFCWNPADPGCITPRKVDWLKRRMQSIIDLTLAGSRN